jgi:hypothetical protein
MLVLKLPLSVFLKIYYLLIRNVLSPIFAVIKKVWDFFVSTLPITNKNSQYYYSDAQLYDNILGKYYSVDSYLDLFYQLDDRKKVNTHRVILFTHKKKPNESDYRYLIRRFGKSSNKFNKNHSPVHTKILFYKLKIGGFRTYVEFHLFNDNLFFVNYKFSKLNTNDKTKILNIIKYKYLKGKDFKMAQQYIMDVNHNALMVADNIYFEINYIATQDSFFKIAKEQNMLLEQKQKELIYLNEKILIDSL